jgi:hypothetical protein
MSTWQVTSSSPAVSGSWLVLPVESERRADSGRDQVLVRWRR